VLTIQFQATSSGAFEVASSFDARPGHDFLDLGDNGPIPVSHIEFGILDLTITPSRDAAVSETGPAPVDRGAASQNEDSPPSITSFVFSVKQVGVDEFSAGTATIAIDSSTPLSPQPTVNPSSFPSASLSSAAIMSSINFASVRIDDLARPRANGPVAAPPAIPTDNRVSSVNTTNQTIGPPEDGKLTASAGPGGHSEAAAADTSLDSLVALEPRGVGKPI
jgi:hypothetical protein